METKPRLSQIVVVEGRDDQSAVLAAVDCELIVTHGFGIRAETWKRIERAAKGPGIIIFTDPDHAGEEIRRHCLRVIGVISAESELVIGLLIRAGVAAGAALHIIRHDGDIRAAVVMQTIGGVEAGAAGADHHRIIHAGRQGAAIQGNGTLFHG